MLRGQGEDVRTVVEGRLATLSTKADVDTCVPWQSLMAEVWLARGDAVAAIAIFERLQHELDTTRAKYWKWRADSVSRAAAAS